MENALTDVSLVLCFSLLGCACPPKDPEALKIYHQDPLEPMNRVILDVNLKLDDYVVSPAVKVYRFVVPSFLRKGFLNFFDNLKAPLSLGNSLMQGNWENAAQITKKFTLNTFFGFFGFFRPSDTAGIVAENADFGQTLGVYGVPSGPYLMLPLIGPSNVRDTVGMGVDTFISPVNWALRDHKDLVYTRLALDSVSKRESADELLKSLRSSSTDYYAMLRSMYMQNRTSKVSTDNEDTPSYEYDFEFED